MSELISFMKMMRVDGASGEIVLYFLHCLGKSMHFTLTIHTDGRCLLHRSMSNMLVQ